MNEKLMNIKEKIAGAVTKALDFLKANLMITVITAFCLVVVAVLLISVFALQEFIVSVCILIVLEVAMAALLHKVELWKHGVLLAAQIVAAIILQRIPLVVLCVVVYVAAIVALQLMNLNSKEETQS